MPAAEILNELLAGASAMPRISMHNASPHMHFEPTSGRLVQWLGATTAMGLGVVLCEHGLARFGLCHADSCEDAFVDTSKNRSRRNCSSSCTTARTSRRIGDVGPPLRESRRLADESETAVVDRRKPMGR